MRDIWVLLAGAFLGFLGSLLATFTAPSIGSVFGKLKLGFIERNKASALASYAEVQDLKSGKWDKYLYALDSWGFILLWMIFFVGCGVVGNLTNDEFAKVGSMGIAVLAMISAIRRMAIMFLTMGRVRKFEEYRAELLRRWPDIELP